MIDKARILHCSRCGKKDTIVFGVLGDLHDDRITINRVIVNKDPNNISRGVILPEILVLRELLTPKGWTIDHNGVVLCSECKI